MLEPHPVTDPKGHSFGVRDQPIVLGDRHLPRDWRQVEEYLYGIDLYNAAFFWEAHESWEAVWHAVGRESLVGGFVQALIQASAALLQRHRGRLGGAHNLLARSSANLEAVHEWLAARHRSGFMGIEIDPWQAKLRAYLSGESGDFPFLVTGPTAFRPGP